MTYCFFSAQYPPRLGGVENHTRRLAEKIVQKGGRAIVVTSVQPGAPAHEISPAGVEVFRLPSLRLRGGRMPVVLPGGVTRRVLATLSGQGIDRIVVQTRLYPLSLLGASFAKKQGIPALLLEHGHAYTVSGNPVIDFGLKIYINLLLRQAYRLCPRFYAVSKSAAGWLQTQGIAVQGLIPNAISADALEEAKASPQRDFRAEGGLPKEAILVAYAGRLVAPKGVMELVEAVRLYNKTAAAPLHLMVAGEGELEPSLRQMAGPQLHVLGSLSFAEVITLFMQSEMVCLPSGMHEGMPSSILEAGGCGAFVLATGLGGTEELVPGAEYGLLVEDNRPETLVDAMQTAMADPAYRQQAAKNLHRHVMQGFTFDALYEILENLPWEATA